jgi:hypothetical protein
MALPTVFFIKRLDVAQSGGEVILSPVAPDLYGGRAITISSRTLATNERKLNHGLSLAVEVSADSDGIAQLPTHPMTRKNDWLLVH